MAATMVENQDAGRVQARGSLCNRVPAGERQAEMTTAFARTTRRAEQRRSGIPTSIAASSMNSPA